MAARVSGQGSLVSHTVVIWHVFSTPPPAAPSDSSRHSYHSCGHDAPQRPLVDSRDLQHFAHVVWFLDAHPSKRESICEVGDSGECWVAEIFMHDRWWLVE